MGERNWWAFSFRWRGWGAVLVLAVGWLALFSLGLLVGRVCLFWACFGGWRFLLARGDIGAGLFSACFGRLVGAGLWRGTIGYCGVCDCWAFWLWLVGDF